MIPPESTRPDDEPFDRDVDEILNRLSNWDKTQILKNVVWCLFGDVDEKENLVLVPGRVPDRIDLAGLVGYLNRQFWPGSSSVVADAEEKGERRGTKTQYPAPEVLDDEHRTAASDELGWEVDDAYIRRALDRTAGYGTWSLVESLEELTDDFEAAGGRGIELADEIDLLRCALAVRQVLQRRRSQ